MEVRVLAWHQAPEKARGAQVVQEVRKVVKEAGLNVVTKALNIEGFERDPVEVRDRSSVSESINLVDRKGRCDISEEPAQ